MKLITTQISIKELQLMAHKSFGILVKAVVDIKKRIMVVDASLHADEEAYLLSNGSKQNDLWGINLYPDLDGEDFIEFDSLINIRPGHGNLTRGIEDKKIRLRIRTILKDIVK